MPPSEASDVSGNGSTATPPPAGEGAGALERLYAATTAISAALDDEAHLLPHLLRRIVDEFAALVEARYAALGLLGDDGGLVSFEVTGAHATRRGCPAPAPPSGAGPPGHLAAPGSDLAPGRSYS